MRLSVPGNLLLAGEYLVLDEGGQGLAVAVEPRITASASISQGACWSVKAIMGASSILWRSDEEDRLPLARFVMRACTEALATRGRFMPTPMSIEIDSSAFFAPGGRKTGFGSSAAAAVALALLVGRAAGLKDNELTDFSAEAALAGHRESQGGRGSGYDIYTSLYGGCGIFTGGEKPSWSALKALPITQAVLVPGPAAVLSSEAVSAYRHWLASQANPEPSGSNASPNDKASDILQAMKAGVTALVAASSSGDPVAFRLAVDQAGTAGRRLGEAIGFSAFITAPPGLAAVTVKALGAGNELGLLVLDGLKLETASILPGGCLPFTPTGGPQWLS